MPLLPSLHKSKHPSPSDNTRGTLQVPENVSESEYVNGEPGVVYLIKGKERPLFLNPPTHKKSELKGDIIFETQHYTPNSPTEEPQVQIMATAHTKKGGEQTLLVAELLNHTKLTDTGKETTEVLARPFEIPDPENPGKMMKHPFLLQVATFERLKDADTEERRDLGHGVTITHLGYMYKDELTPKESFHAVKGNIFPHEPSLADVEQSKMGDCFLLSSINAILSQPGGPDIIKGMMRQQDDGSVIVRFFDPVKLEPIFVKVENTELHHEKNTSAVTHNAPWVHVLEKAYAGLGYEVFKDEKKDQYQSVQPIEPLLSQNSTENVGIRPQAFVTTLAGGHAALALTLITGERAKKTVFNSELLENKDVANYPFNAQNNAPVTNLFFTTDSLLDAIYKPRSNQFLDELKNDPDYPSKIEKIIDEKMPELVQQKNWEGSNLPEILGDDLTAWVIYSTKLQVLYPDTKQQLSDIVSQAHKMEQGKEYAPANSSEFSNILKDLKKLTPPPPDNVLKKFEAYAEKTMSGPIGSGHYSQNAQELFNTLESNLKAGKVLTASTSEKTDGKDIGLVSEHEYTITNVFKEKHNGKDVLMVQVRNPWNSQGVKYESDNHGGLVAVNDPTAAEFKLDINDFKKHFDAYTIGTAEKLKNINKEKLTLGSTANIQAKPKPSVIRTASKDTVPHKQPLRTTASIARDLNNKNTKETIKQLERKQVTKEEPKPAPAQAKQQPTNPPLIKPISQPSAVMREEAPIRLSKK